MDNQPHWPPHRIEAELAFLVRAVSETQLAYEDWYVLLDRSQRADLRGATKAQWNLFNRCCQIMEQRLDELRPSRPESSPPERVADRR